MTYSPSGPQPIQTNPNNVNNFPGSVPSGTAIILLKTSENSSDRPEDTAVAVGEAAVCLGPSDPGMYMLNVSGSLLKIGPTGYGATAPNSSPVGAAGNSQGELWVDSSTAGFMLRTWNGAAWVAVGAAAHASISKTLSTDPLLISLIPEGTLAYQEDAPSGLFMRYSTGWVPV